MMRAIDIKGGKGPKEALFMNAETPKPKAEAGQAIVKIKAFGINRMDLHQREGLYPVPPQAPATLGVEFSGIIESFADGNDSAFKVGDEVFGLAYGGAYAEYIAVSTKMLLHKPPHKSFVQAAAVPETWITAVQALHVVGEFSAGKSVLWHAGASNVSLAGIQLSRQIGASTIYATAGSDQKCAFLVNEMGVTGAFNYKTEDWAAKIKELTGGAGVDFIVDFVGANYFQKNIDTAARDGRIVLLATLSGGKVDGVDISQILYKRLRIEGTTLRARNLEYQGRLRDYLEQYLPRFESGELKVVIDTVLPWEQIQEAHGLMEENTTSGKIVCTIS